MKRIGIDIDGVIADTQPVIIQNLNAHFGKNHSMEEFVNFEPEQMYGIDRQQLDNFIMERELDIIKATDPREDAVKIINQLKKEFTVHLISARTPAYLGNTREWLSKHGIPYDNIIHLGHHDKRSSCMDERVDLFIEDNKRNAIQISSCGIPVYLFDATYNQGELPSLVRRVFSWVEIYQWIKKDFCMD